MTNELFYTLEEKVREEEQVVGEMLFNPPTLTAINTRITFTSSTPVALNDTLVVKLWALVFSRYKEHYLLYDYKTFFQKLYTIIVMTYDKYKALFDGYTAKASHFLDAIKTTTTNKDRFNDTPQNAGDFENEDWTTTISLFNSEVGEDRESPVVRLRELKNNYDNTLMDWANLFDNLFIEEANL